jgi:hypothetical protein
MRFNNFRRSRCVSQFLAAALLSLLAWGCKKDAPDTPSAEAEAPATATLPPVEAEGTQQNVQEKAAESGKTPEKTREELVKEEIITEFSGVMPAARQAVAMVSPEGKICWPAMTCTNRRCSGQGKDGRPFLFAYHYKAVTLGSDGKLDFRANLQSKPLVLLGTCPACFMANTVEAYLPPDERKRFDEISRRLMKKAHENAAITKNRLLTADESAAYRKLQEEQANMPVYYLCP